MLTMRKITSCPNLRQDPDIPTKSHPIPNRFSSRIILQPSHQGLTGFLHNLYENIKESIYPTTETTITETRVKTCLPLPYSGKRTIHVFPILEKIFQHTLFNLHYVMENLQYWEAISDSPCNWTVIQYAEVTTLFKTLKRALLMFLSQLYVEVDLFNRRPLSSVAFLLKTINCLFFQLEESVRIINRICHISPLNFEYLPDRDEANSGSDQNDYDINDASLIHSNLKKLDLYLSTVIDKHRKPSKIRHHRIKMYYTLGAIGVSLLSIWLLRDTSVVFQAKEYVSRFFSYHVEQPLATIRDGLYDRVLHLHEVRMALEDLQSKSEILHSAEKHFSQSIQSLTKDEMSNFIELQQLNNLFDAACTEMSHQISMADERRSEFFASLPKYLLSFGALVISPWVMKYITRASPKISSITYERRKVLMDEIECRVLQIERFHWPPHTKRAHYSQGLLLCSLDRLYKDAETDAKAFEEWESLQGYLFVLGNTGVASFVKHNVVLSLKIVFDCLYPPKTYSLDEFRRVVAESSEQESTS